MLRFDEALMAYEKAIALDTGYAEAHFNQGLALQEMGRLDEAIALYRQSILLNPEFAEGYCNLGFALLKSGDFATGWTLNEWRWRAESSSTFRERREFSEPLWLGKDVIAGKTILLYGEQGLGDSLQFCRYIPMVAALGSKVILEVPAPLVSVCKTLEGVAEVIPFGSVLTPFDYQCPLMSLPLAFATTLDTVPATPGYIKSDAGKVAIWQARLGPKLKPRVGLTWSGQTAGTNRKRHFPLSLLTPYLSDRFQYFCLQIDIASADQATLDQHPGIFDYGDALRGFANTAALCECMDVVVSVDTSIAHLAGALGKTTWVLLAFDADWRWLANRDDSPWYPTMRLYRQRSRGDWTDVFERLAADLDKAFPRS
jgi:tetratricopeptide (TPR) repeat protein